MQKQIEKTTRKTDEVVEELPTRSDEQQALLDKADALLDEIEEVLEVEDEEPDFDDIMEFVKWLETHGKASQVRFLTMDFPCGCF